ncbi:hypothetical protein PFICI_13036 [Pestalotiopsis fici W106-1]|uniref:Uncharacterized protein n=1 Tax=Pestalotiopsis fici (strain W106-1 / CGMCC3.15140) TaxID=1229662 RepID=W3WN06_PESFW|nr:uncharacterized protein PFICI_13036 [Pestalotiopsis fici W106-1]ETS74552.1 hypothetical protein PFICI_13036 [Pestalotiopsis fici W106-1]
MAGSFPDVSLPNSSFFNIYTDGGSVARTSPAPALPGGQCNFVDLAHGANGPKCGCRRFWSRNALGLNNGFSDHSIALSNGGSHIDQSAFCMCSHHACYHDDIQPATQQGPFTAPIINSAGQENEKPRAGREPLTPVMPDMSFQVPPPVANQSMEQNTIDNNASFSTNIHQDVQLFGNDEDPAPPAEASIPDTMSWTNLLQSQPNYQGDVAPSIASQCLQPASQPSSTTSSTRLAYLKPFGGKGLNTFSTPRSKLREALQITPDPEDRRTQHDSVNRNAAPSIDDLQTVTNTPRSTRSGRRADVPSQLSQPARTEPRRTEFQELANTVQGHEERIERLETVSFQNDHEDCRDQHEQTDLRVTELTSRVEELEKTLNDGSSVVSSHYHTSRHRLDQSAASVASVTTTGSGRTDRAEMQNELALLKAQLNHLQASSFPTASKPWEVEVVFLPFPLKGVWYQSRDFPSQRTSGATIVDHDEWTQMPNSSSTIETQLPDLHEWAGPELQSEWLLPRACAPGNVVDLRLRSRGLIKNVVVRSPDARSVQQAVSAAFGTLFRTFSRLQANVHHGSTTHHRMSRFFGLKQPWIPLRKIHKDSRLRFLSPDEMVTSTSWDVSFLSSSVVMKATGVHRLYITQPEAYLQDQDAYDNGWSWQRLRELSRVYPDSQGSQLEVPEADAMETYWTWNDKLDENSSSQDSMHSLSLRQAAQPRLKSRTPSQHLLHMSRSGPSPSLSSSRSRAASPAILRERKSSIPRPIRVRTTSMPPTLPPLASPSQGRRRMATATFGTIQQHYFERRPSPQLLRASTGSALALTRASRRRSTRSPSVPLSARLRNTPRWSAASPSPLLATMNIGEPFAIISGEGEVHAACRQTTPYYYATPHSNAPHVESRSYRGMMDIEDDHGSGTDYSYEDGQDDTEAESDEDDEAMLDLGHPRRIREESEWPEWEGVQQRRPEDEVLVGIEDVENRDPEDLAHDSDVEDEENRDPEDLACRDVEIYEDLDDRMEASDDDAENQDDGQCSSGPSEYSTRQHAWPDIDNTRDFPVFDETNG